MDKQNTIRQLKGNFCKNCVFGDEKINDRTYCLIQEDYVLNICRFYAHKDRKFIDEHFIMSYEYLFKLAEGIGKIYIEK